MYFMFLGQNLKRFSAYFYQNRKPNQKTEKILILYLYFVSVWFMYVSTKQTGFNALISQL